MQRTCARCGETFEGRSSRATYCSTKCRVAANREANGASKPMKPVVDGVVIQLPPPGQSGLVKAVRAKVRGRTTDPISQIAIALAKRIENSDGDSGSSLAALSRELRSVLAQSQAGRVVPKPAAAEPAKVPSARRTVGKVAEFRRRRDAAGDA